MLWFTADLHLGHANIIAYTGRPFAGPEEMDEALVAAWNATVAAEDTVWVLGDFALGRIDQTLPTVARLGGRKLLVPGNHDRCWAGQCKGAEGWTRRYREAGFAEVVEGPVELTVGGHQVLAHHFPYHGDSRDHERFGAHRPLDRGAWLLHGHVHDRWRQAGRQLNVGVDAWGGRPVGEGELVRLIEAGPAVLDPLEWAPGLS